MKQVLLLIVLLVSQSLFAQEAPNISTFHRLLIFNESRELMIARFEDSDRWVTPGWYQDDRLTIREGLDALAASHGLKITAPVLRGVFTLKDAASRVISTRLVYSTRIESGDATAPEGIGEVKWLPVSEAMETITFPHIREQVRQLTRYPDVVWGGSQTREQENGAAVSRIVEDFYPLARVERK